MKSMLPVEARRHQRPAGQGDEAGVEPFGFEEALVHRDVARDMEAAAADDLADGDLGLRPTPRRSDKPAKASSAKAHRGRGIVDRSIGICAVLC